MAIAPTGRRTHRNEDRIGARHRLLQVGREGKPPGRHIGRHQLVEPRLVDRHPAGLQRFDLAVVLVDTDDVVSEIGKARARDETDITRTDHRDAHGLKLPLT